MYLLTSGSRVLLEKLIDSQLGKKFPAFYGTWRFITTFTRDYQLSLSWAINPSSHFLESHLNIFLPSMPGSSKWSPSLRFLHQNPVCTSSLPHTCYMPHPSHSSRFDHPNSVWWAIQIIKLLIMQFSPLPCHLVPPWVRGLWSVIVNLLIDVSLCLVRLSHTEALYKQTFDPLTFKNRASYIYRTGVPLPSRCCILYIFFHQI